MLLEKNLKCELDIPPNIMIKIDANKMQRVFDNLLRNAVNYGHYCRHNKPCTQKEEITYTLIFGAN